MIHEQGQTYLLKNKTIQNKSSMTNNLVNNELKLFSY